MLLAGVLLGTARAALAAAPVSWASYRASAAAALADGARRPLRLPPQSPLRATAVRFPGGAVVALSPALVVGGLAEPPGSPPGRLARTTLAAIAAAPSAPPPAAAPAAAQARLRRILDRPAFASARPGPLWRLRQALSATGARVLDAAVAAAAALVRLGRRMPAGARRAGGLLLAVCALAGGVWAGVGLLRAGAEPPERRGNLGAAGPPGPAPQGLGEADAALARGDAGSALRLAYAAGLRHLTAAHGIAVRPGWSARDVLRAPGVAEAWPGLGAVAELYERLVFGPPVPAAERAAVAAAAAARLEEVRRWVAAGAARGASLRRSP